VRYLKERCQSYRRTSGHKGRWVFFSHRISAPGSSCSTFEFWSVSRDSRFLKIFMWVIVYALEWRESNLPLRSGTFHISWSDLNLFHLLLSISTRRVLVSWIKFWQVRVASLLTFIATKFHIAWFARLIPVFTTSWELSTSRFNDQF